MASSDTSPELCQVVIVGAGPSGLSLAMALDALGLKDIIVLERQSEGGGIPRHCGHYPFGVFEYGKMLKGPAYAQLLCDKAEEAGIRVLTRTTVTELGEGGCIKVSTPEGEREIKADRVVLAMGARESSRAQRLISGQRPTGVISTGALQSMIYQQGKRPFERPVILGSELVSFSAIMTCHHLGVKPVAMLEESKRVIARSITGLFPRILGIPLHTGVRDISIEGNRRVESVSWQDRNGKQRSVETDGVIVSGHFRPEAALIIDSHLELDPGTRGPSTDQFGRCSDPAYFCVGNLLRPIETSAWCWTEGRDLASILIEDLSGESASYKKSDPHHDPEIVVELGHESLKYSMPQRLTISPRQAHVKNLQIRLTRPVKGRLKVMQSGTVLWEQALNSRPERRILIPLESWIDRITDAPLVLNVEEFGMNDVSKIK